MKILILDNYDSFTYNISNCIKQLGYRDIQVVRNDKINLENVKAFDKIILSPGPGLPNQAGLMPKLINEYASTKSILGICLGHQAIGEAFGAKLENLKNLFHAKTSEIFLKEKDYIFDTIPSPFIAGRYHSWIVSENNLPDCIKISAIDSNNQIMALKHSTYDLHGVQFHPESILTPVGFQILKNFLSK